MFEIEEAIRIDRPAAEAWAMLIDFPNVPAWEDGVIEVRQTSSGSPSIGTTLLARRAYGPWKTDVDCRITDWQEGRSVTMEIMGGPTRRATTRYAVEPAGDDAVPGHVLRERRDAAAPGVALADHPVRGPSAPSFEPRSLKGPS